MEWLSQNWIWVLFIAAFIAMHMFGHSGHGGHGRHGGRSDGGDKDAKPPSKDDAQHTAKGHQH
jgi:DUF2933 family protein